MPQRTTTSTRRRTASFTSTLSSHASDLSDASTATTSESSYKSPLSSLPAIPDLRFEQSYIATIRGFLHEVDKQDANHVKRNERLQTGKKHAEPHLVQKTSDRQGEPEIWLGALRVEWYVGQAFHSFSVVF